MLLERARLSMQSFQEIAELALTQANFSQTLVRKEPVSPIETGYGLLADYYYDEALVIIAHDINAKFGIDLKEVKIAKAQDNSVVVSGIRPRFIGANQNESKTLVKEIRRVDNKFGVPYRVRIKDQRQDVALADIKADQYELEFQKKLSEGMEMAFMNNAIVQLAQNFIKIVLTPLYSNIVFNNVDAPEALPLLDFLTKEINENNEEKYRLLQINEQFILQMDQFDRYLETDTETPQAEGGM
jgi:phage terminase Nu1 subunit (DNA packaging protein)